MKIENDNKKVFPKMPWDIIETSFNIKNNYRNETIFALGNGYLGTRGTFEEAYNFNIDTGLEGNFINGFYESALINNSESGQFMLNLPNAKKIKLFVCGEEFDMRQGNLISYERRLDLKKGILKRDIAWESPKKHLIHIEIKRFISFKRRNLLIIEYRATPLNFSGELRFISETEANIINHMQETNLNIEALVKENIQAYNNKTSVTMRVKNNKFYLHCGTILALKKYSPNNQQMDFTPNFSSNIKNECPVTETSIFLNEGETAALEKTAGYWTTLELPHESLKGICEMELHMAFHCGYEEMEKEQRDYMASFWENADIEIEGDISTQQAIRFNLFHILQGTPRIECTSIAAKCLTSESCEGNYFGALDLFLINPFICFAPETAKNILDYRSRTLEQAYSNAREAGHKKGALFPWQTINGNESLQRTAQLKQRQKQRAHYHVNADIVYALNKYLQMTNDTDYLLDKGAEIFIETARLWLDLGAFTEYNGRKFCICGVTGPEENASIVNNNFYTNSMAAENMKIAYDALKKIKSRHPERYAQLKNKLDLKDNESENWLSAALNMYYPYDKNLRLFGQDDSFLYKKPVTDLLLTMMLLSDNFSAEEKRRHFDFFLTAASHDSPASAARCFYGILACDIGYYDKALKYLNITSRLDLDDYNDDVYAGIHAVNMAGTWMLIIHGFAGMRVYDNVLSFKPRIPETWKSYRFKVIYNGSKIAVTVTRDAEASCAAKTACAAKATAEFKLIEGEPLSINVDDKQIFLNFGSPKSV